MFAVGRVGFVCFAAFAAVGECAQVAGSFMLVSGTTSDTEMCVVAKSSSPAVALSACETVASDEYAIWKWTSAGKLTNMGSQSCLGSAAQHGSLLMTSCDATGSAWEFTEDGQLRSKGSTSCVKSKGTAGMRNVAYRAAAVASSTGNAAHGAGKALDGSGFTYWASRFGDVSPVTFTVDFGTAETIDVLEIVWATVPKSFTVAVAEGNDFVTTFEADSNMLNVSKISFGGRVAAKLRITLRETHPIKGKIANRDVFSIAAVRAVSNGPGLEMADCAEAAKAETASDKFFMTTVLEYDPAARAAYLAEVPALESAMASLTTTAAQLASVVPHIASCGAALLVERSVSGNRQPAAVDVDSADSLLAEARTTILLARSALA